jgi:hypothetical protein
MSNYETFDDFNSTEMMNEFAEQPPFQFREETDEEGTLQWLNLDYDSAEKGAQSRLRSYRRWMALYKGIHWRDYDYRDYRRDDNGYSSRKPRHVVNFIYEMTEARVAQSARMKSSVVAIPHDEGQDDVNNAKSCKMLLDARAYDLQIEKLFQEADRTTYTMGHSFLCLYWDKDIGPTSPTYEKLKKRDAKAAKKFDGPVKIGDVACRVKGPDRIFVERGKKSWEEIDYLHEIEWMPLEEAKARWPKKKELIKENVRQLYNWDTTELSIPKSQIMIRTFWHIPTKFLPEGMKIIYCDDTILEMGDFPYEHGNLPFVPQTDIDVYSEFWGRPFITNIEQMQRMYNNIQSGIARDFGVGSAPKWVMPKGACDINSLNNDFTVIEFTGPIEPKLVTKSPTNQGNFQLQEMLEGKISQLSNVYDISRGQVPSGVTANSALRFLDEQESQRIIVQQQKRKRTVLSTYKMMMQLMAQYYTAKDDRTVRILGKTNEYLIKSMKKANFGKIYDVELQNTSALPDTKTGKIAAIIDLNAMTQTDPIFRKEEVIEMLDLGTEDHFQNAATVAVNAARTNLQAILEGEEAPEPQQYDELMVHYSVFCKAVQESTFKTSVSKEVNARVIVYISVLEALMFERAKKNMKFLMEVAELSNYPIFFKPETTIAALVAANQQMMAAAAMGPQGSAPLDSSKAKMAQESIKLEQQGEV